MISAISKCITNPTLASVAQNTNASVSIETTLKAIGRPGFILIDNDIDHDTKKYAATKEFLYQATCLLVYMALVVPVFKKGAFKIAKNVFKDEAAGFQKFKNTNEYLEYHKLAEKLKDDRVLSLEKSHSLHKFKHDGLREDLLTKDKPDTYSTIKGAIEFGSIIGSVFGLAILAPQISHATIHPALRFLGMENKKEDKAKTLSQVQEQPKKIDTKA